ncbi:hypothetical protein BpHYR1_049560 [Brachionus plicatilis]|uniref:SWIM-type domain-containing protein n=1 Tax=Brachionus plicatilis TaxID=10195 RepID=A0A3M7RJ79_BRAPC|nr:hypothetical protein BpHYR1_049560 [Brachionus plicatilis]
MATAVIQDKTVSSSNENVLVYQDTSDDEDSDIGSETLHRKRKGSKNQVYNVHNNYQLFDEALEDLNKIVHRWYNAGIMDGSCRWYIKNNICKHLIGISKIQHIPGCEIPLSVKNIPIGEKRKPGRPAKAKQALIVQ